MQKRILIIGIACALATVLVGAVFAVKTFFYADQTSALVHRAGTTGPWTITGTIERIITDDPFQIQAIMLRETRNPRQTLLIQLGRPGYSTFVRVQNQNTRNYGKSVTVKDLMPLLSVGQKVEIELAFLRKEDEDKFISDITTYEKNPLNSLLKKTFSVRYPYVTAINVL